jgi:hypothetical protein
MSDRFGAILLHLWMVRRGEQEKAGINGERSFFEMKRGLAYRWARSKVTAAAEVPMFSIETVRSSL